MPSSEVIVIDSEGEEELSPMGGDGGLPRAEAIKRRQERMRLKREESERKHQLELWKELKKMRDRKRKRDEQRRKEETEAKARIEAQAQAEAEARAAQAQQSCWNASKPGAHHAAAVSALNGAFRSEGAPVVPPHAVALHVAMDALRKEKLRLESELAQSERQRKLRTAHPHCLGRRGTVREVPQLRIEDEKSYDSRIPPDCVGDLLMICDFVRTFSNVINVSPFPMNALADAVFQGPSVLLTELHVALLRLLLLQLDELVIEQDSQPTEGASLVVDAAQLHVGMVTPSTWNEVLAILLPRLAPLVELLDANEGETGVVGSDHRDPCTYASTFVRKLLTAMTSLREKEYHELTVAEKLALLRFVIDTAYSTNKICDYVQKEVTKREEVLQRARREEAEHRRIQREIAVARREEVLRDLRHKMERRRAAETSADQQPSTSLDPTSAEINAAYMALVQSDFPGGHLAVREVPEFEPLSDDEADADLNLLSRDEKVARRRARSNHKEQRRLWKQKERTRRAKVLEERAIAVTAVQDALGNEADAERLQKAIEHGQAAGLEGDGWCTAEMRLVYRRLHEVQRRQERLDADAELARSLSAFSIRTEPLGYDRHARTWYFFEAEGKLFLETLVHRESKKTLGEHMMESMAARLESEHRAAVKRSRVEQSDPQEFLGFKARLLQAGWPDDLAARAAAQSCIASTTADESSPSTDSVPMAAPVDFSSTWTYIEAYEDNVKAAVAALDSYDPRERSLRQRILQLFGLRAEDCVVGSFQWLKTGHDFLGKRVRRQYEVQRRGRKRDASVCWGNGTVVGWISAELNEGLALWHVLHEDGDEEDLELAEVEEALRAAEEYTASHSSGNNAEGGGTCSLGYVNKLSKHGHLTENELGIPALRSEMQAVGAAVAEVVELSEGECSAWQQAAVRAASLPDVIHLLLMMERSIWSLQDGDDEEEQQDDVVGFQEAAALETAESKSSSDSEEEGTSDVEVMSIGASDSTTTTKSHGEARLVANGTRAGMPLEGCKKATTGTTLWPSRADRRRWIAAVEQAQTIATVALALTRLVEAAHDSGICRGLLVSSQRVRRPRKRRRTSR